MKPSLSIAVIAFMSTVGACQPTGSISGSQPEVPDIKLPPEGKPGGGTSNACGGVTERGQCQAGIAVTCDVGSDQLRQVDCQALGKECAIDPDRGAGCFDLGLGAPGEGPCRGLVNATGSCNENGAAVWCDLDSNQIYAWNCGQSGLACQVDGCQSGAYCCAEQPPDPDECEILGFDGVCEGQTARWCSNGNVISLDCAAAGKACEVDTCAQGAYCCVPPEANPCPELGNYGECNGTTLSYCVGDSLVQGDCPAGSTCELDVCFNGADCCTAAEYAAACESIGYDGKCAGPTGSTVVWCENSVIQHLECTNGCTLNGTFATCN